jgi:hypothetical protein
MYGYDDLKPEIQFDRTSVECPVRGCARRVARQREKFCVAERFRCPEHRIVISPSTFEYEREVDNLLCRDTDDLALLAKVKRVKRESRMARDNSEDAVTWNFFRSLEKANALGLFAGRFLGGAAAGQPRVAYWTCCPDTFARWKPLVRAASAFGEQPRRYSEPDLVLLSEDLLAFVEAKLGSGNATTPSNPNDPKSYETGYGEWFRSVFREGASFRSVAVEARLYELMRLWLIGTRVAYESDRRFVLVSLVRSGAAKEADIEDRFGPFITQSDHRRFLRLTWEQVLSGLLPEIGRSPEVQRLAPYFAGKTLGYAGKRERDREFGVLQWAFESLGASLSG